MKHTNNAINFKTNEIYASSNNDNLKRLQYKLIKLKVKEILYNSLAQACIKIFKTPHSTQKIFLIICICLTSSLTAYLVIQSFIDYYKYEVSTTTRTIFEIPSVFPMVTICQSSPFTTPFALEFLKEISRLNFKEIDWFNSTQVARLDTETKFNYTWRLYLLATSRMNERTFSPVERRKLGFDLKDILLMCKYNNQKCDSNDFVWTFSSLYGNCFAFNSAPNGQNDTKKSYIAGSMYGLKLAFYINYDNSLTFFNSIFYFSDFLFPFSNWSLYALELLFWKKESISYPVD